MGKWRATRVPEPDGFFELRKVTAAIAMASQPRRRVPRAVVYDPEDVGLMLWKWAGTQRRLPGCWETAGSKMPNSRLTATAISPAARSP